MKKIITIIAALTLTLVSCKKEDVLTSYTKGSFEINRDIGFTSVLITKNGNEANENTLFNIGDTLRVEVKNTSFEPQNAEILIYAFDNFIQGSEKDLEYLETLSLMHIF
tara:strand:+ start:4313 stop:4639 length:327 start_codon:yes stop_codon:yes gene_type:complete